MNNAEALSYFRFSTLSDMPDEDICKLARLCFDVPADSEWNINRSAFIITGYNAKYPQDNDRAFEFQGSFSYTIHGRIENADFEDQLRVYPPSGHSFCPFMFMMAIQMSSGIDPETKAEDEWRYRGSKLRITSIDYMLENIRCKGLCEGGVIGTIAFTFNEFRLLREHEVITKWQ